MNHIEYGDPALTWETHVAQSAVKTLPCLEASWKFHEALLDYAHITQTHYQNDEWEEP